MKKTIFSKAIAILGSIAMLVGVAACGQSNDSTKTAADGNGLTKVTFMLFVGARHQPYRRVCGEEQRLFQAGRS